MVVEDHPVESPALAAKGPIQNVGELRAPATAPPEAMLTVDLVSVGRVDRVPGSRVPLTAGGFEDPAHLQAVLCEGAAEGTEDEAASAFLHKGPELLMILLPVQAELAGVRHGAQDHQVEILQLAEGSVRPGLLGVYAGDGDSVEPVRLDVVRRIRLQVEHPQRSLGGELFPNADDRINAIRHFGDSKRQDPTAGRLDLSPVRVAARVERRLLLLAE